MTTETPGSAEQRAIDALTRILESAIAPDMLEAQQLILRRLATSGDLFPSRIPPPRNITEVGGYLNLIQADPVLTAQALASALGVAGPNPSPGFAPTLPPLYYVTVPNDRPAGTAQAGTPVQIGVRSDFATAFTSARDALHAAGVTLPALGTSRPLPPVALGVAPPTDLLPYLGRLLELVPGAALIDPAVDPLAVGQAAGTGPQVVVARQVDASAPAAGDLTPAPWSLWTCDTSACTQGTVTDRFLELAPVLNAAGWYCQEPLASPTSLGAPGGWNRWTNLTGLVAGTSTFGDELRLLHPIGTISASSVRERLDWVWDGTAFVGPA
jgi:hypothetical protein